MQRESCVEDKVEEASDSAEGKLGDRRHNYRVQSVAAAVILP